MIPIRGFEGRAVGVVGLGRTGLAAARALQAGGARPVVWDDSETARARAAAEGFEIVDLAAPPEDLALARLIVSPGVAHLYPEPHPTVAQAMARGVPLDNDVGLFFAEIARLDAERAAMADAPAASPETRVIAITGTNGKSTTTALIHHILTASGRTAHLGGNIGWSVLDLPTPAPGDLVVLELSSYQLELARELSAFVGVFINLAPDHLDRHGGQGGYFAAKARLLEQSLYPVIGVDEPEGRFLANRVLPDAGSLEGQTAEAAVDVLGAPVAASVLAPPHGFPAGVHLEGDALSLRRWPGAAAETAPLAGAAALKGDHNAQNAACAVAACLAVGCALEDIQAGLESFPGLAHRMRRVAEADGVVFVNDSKATNADAAEKALKTFDKVRWILGGRAKEGGIEALRPLFDRVEKAYLIGEATEQFAKSLRAYPEEVAFERCETLAAAVALAAREAQAGETVLLAPAAASFDQFPDFEARGDAFVAAVHHALGKPAEI